MLITAIKLKGKGVFRQSDGQQLMAKGFLSNGYCIF